MKEITTLNVDKIVHLESILLLAVIGDKQTQNIDFVNMILASYKNFDGLIRSNF